MNLQNINIDIENKLMVIRGGISQEFGDQQIHTTIYKIGKHKGLLDSTENCVQCFVMNYKGKEYEKTMSV